MRFVKQAVSINVQNMDNVASNKKPKTKRHSQILPNSIRCIIAGILYSKNSYISLTKVVYVF